MIQSIVKAVRQVTSKIWPSKKYNRINWQNRPSTATALGATNLNKIDVFCNEVDNALIQIDAGKLDIATANSMLASVSFNQDTGTFTFKELDGTTYTYDLNLEKIPVSFSLSEDGILTMTTEDGTQWTCNIGELIKDYVFDDSDTIAFEKEFVEEDDEGKGSYHVTASVKAGSINETHLDPDYRSDILTYTTQAQTAANDSLTYSKDSKRWAVGDAEYEGSATDNAKYYKEQAEAAKQAAEEARDEAQAATGTVIATTEHVGVVKPDGTTIKVDEDGTIHGANQFDGSGYTYVDGEAIDPPSTSDEAILDADKLGGQLPGYYAADANVVKKADISNVQADSTSTVPSSALLKSTDDKIGDTSNLPGDASDVVSAITQLNSDLSISHINPEQLTQDYYNVSSIVCRVRAGWCFVSMDVTVLKVYTTHPGIDLLTGLPNPSFDIASQPFVEWSSTTNNLPLRTYIRTKDGIGVVSFRNGTVGKTHPLFFSYPIA